MSSKLVNLHKSLVQFFNNIQGAMKRRLEEALNILLFNDINKYLDCPISQGRVKRSTFLGWFLSPKKC